MPPIHPCPPDGLPERLLSVRLHACSPPRLAATQLARSSVLNRLIAPAGLSPALMPASRAHTEGHKGHKGHKGRKRMLFRSKVRRISIACKFHYTRRLRSSFKKIIARNTAGLRENGADGRRGALDGMRNIRASGSLGENHPWKIAKNLNKTRNCLNLFFSERKPGQDL